MKLKDIFSIYEKKSGLIGKGDGVYQENQEDFCEGILDLDDFWTVGYALSVAWRNGQFSKIEID